MIYAIIFLAAACAALLTIILVSRANSSRNTLQKEQMRLEFRDIAGDILAEKSAQNREAIDLLLKPFKDNISDFRERIERIYADENQQRGALRNEIRNLQELNRQITTETTNLTAALKGNSKVQGDWGEMILETILESSNLSRGIHYTVQENFRGTDGSLLRPDVVLNLPEGKRIVIDSKVSLSAFVDQRWGEHVSSVRRHVAELGRKEYQKLVESPDFVIMFIPSEPAFMAALQADQTIWDDAYRNRVIISSPTNLFALLKIVDDLWKRDKQSKNALEIAEQGARLYDKFAGFVETLESVGKGIKNASDNYEKAMSQLATGPGNLVGRTEKLRKLGLKTAKALSITSDEEDDAEVND